MSNVKRLHDGAGFPVAIVNLAETSAKPAGRFAFGVSKEGLSASLRALADAVEAGDILPQDVVHITRAATDDFVLHRLLVKFAARRTLEGD